MPRQTLALDPDIRPRRLKLRVRGVVQGVGFRPFVFALARRMGLTGFVLNDREGVLIEVEGTEAADFGALLRAQAPPLAQIDTVETGDMPLADSTEFLIADSVGGKAATRIGPDAAACKECLLEMRNPQSRFFGYAFINCTHCGPRYTITQSLPYDRKQTAMAGFAMCPACAEDYRNPGNRRFHAEPIACTKCGPALSHSIGDIATAIGDGKIVALKGIGGFHLICDTRNSAAIDMLRRRKARDEKPFAVMVADVEAARHFADTSTQEQQLLASAARPIVLAASRGNLPESLAPGLNRIGIILAYAPVHHLIFDALAENGLELPVALVATSANPGGEPLVAGNVEAERRLATIADMIVTHDRDIVVRTDDSVMQVIAGAPAFVRRSRGFVPEPVDLGSDGPSIIALGADLKNAICVTRGREAFLSQHVGGLGNVETIRFQHETVAHLCRILDVTPDYAACDLHPDFRSTRLAESLGLPLVRVQHHLAHAAAVAAEHQLRGPCLGLVLDGHGYGADGGIWGGELLDIDGCRWRRAGHLSPLPLAGGDKAAREPWRMGIGALHSAGRADLARSVFADMDGPQRLLAMLERKMKVATTSSMGRLFDAAAAISGTRMVQSFEGQAAMEFEALAMDTAALKCGYRFENSVLDFGPLLVHIAERGLRGMQAASLFHATLVEGLAEWVIAESLRQGTTQIVLSGGCMMNRRLAEGLPDKLRSSGLTTLLPQAMPANDGGLSLGQAAHARQVIDNDRSQIEEL
ncbi:carbamoyltransferase HypF [Hoeflea sp.]|uniref:carbamoyltransferase HypF n=1 Tax=Hoeflea sp. TaxID=1940281 RepID=UPI0037486868